MNRLGPITGVLLGTAVGDALGLVREGLSPRRAQRLYGDPPFRHHFLFGRGMVSDDTEHTYLVSRALLRAPDNTDRFARSLAWELRWWLLALPSGLGRATLRAGIKLWLGFPPSWSGVFSAGNGPAMRSALLGVCLGDDPEKLLAYVRASTRLTHTDPRAERGALLVALAAWYGTRYGAGVDAGAFLSWVREGQVELDPEATKFLAQIDEHLGRKAPAAELAAAMSLNRGVSGYIYHTVPLALYCWLRQPGDFRAAVEEVIALGGDADTTGAIVGAIAGATAGPDGIPTEWIQGLFDWPCSVSGMRDLADRLAAQFPGPGTDQKPPFFWWPMSLPRNLFFLVLVLLHAMRRLLPPY